MTPTREELYSRIDTLPENRIPQVIAFIEGIEALGECRPNATTIEAMQEADRILKDPDVKGYTDIDELFDALRS